MDQVYLLVDHAQNRQIIGDWLAEDYDVIDQHDHGLEETDFDICIVDESALSTHSEILEKKKAAERPSFLPILFVTPNGAEGNSPKLWNLVDDLIVSPVKMSHLKAKLDVLLRTRRLTKESQKHSQQMKQIMQAVESTSDGIIILDSHDQISYANKAFTRLYGYPTEETGEIDVKESLFADQGIGTEIMEAVHRQQTWSGEVILRTKDREVVYTLLRVDRVIDDYGNYAGAVYSMTNITAHKQAEVAKSRLAAIVRNSNDAILSKALDGTILTWNYGAEQMFGYTEEEAIGQNVAMLIYPPEIRVREYIILERVKHGEHVSQYETIRLTKAGNRITVSLTIAPLLDHDGKIVGASAISRDITRQKYIERAEKEQRAMAEALRDTATALTSTLKLPEVLERILINLQHVVPHDAANIMLVEDRIAYVVRCRGYQEHEHENLMQTRTEIGVSSFLQQMADSKQPLIVPDVSKTSSAWVANYSWPYLSYLGVPIHLRGEIIGFINLNIKPANFFTPIHADRLKAFSEQANIAIQNARLFAQSRELAVLEERQRLARDLHDAVSQTLFSATVISEALPRIWKNSPDRVETLLHELHELTRGALAETRALLMELRPASLLAIEFQALLQQLVEAMQSRRNIKISLMVDQLPELPADVKIAFYRITQEALNNIVKHASATEANIMLQRRRKSIRLSIFDNGVGFDKDEVEPISFGLSIMNERAESIDARFKIYSEVGQGTQIVVIWVNDLMDTGSLE